MNSRVLIVDDSLTVRMDLAEAFEAAGFDTVACATAAEAWQSLRAQKPALLVLDVLLPDSDGVDFLRTLREGTLHSTLPVVLLSSETEVRDRIRGLRMGADEYVGKPYDAGYLVARSKQLIAAQAVSGDPRPAVLVIDDSLTFREELRAMLEREGYRVLTANSGEEGLRLAAEARPAAMVVDGQLPGVDGATVIRRIRLDAALRQTPCLLLTASDDRSAELRAYEAGADAFVKKGGDGAVLVARLSAVLRTRIEPAGGNAPASLSAPKRVLAVDDSATFLSTVSEALRDEGYDVVCARSGEEAIELLAVQPVDCILLDVMMPGMGGQEACRRIKAAPMIRDVPLIMLTGLEDRRAMVEGLGAGADDYIAKSHELDVLKARVLAQIRRRQFEDENRRIREQLVESELQAAAARSARELAETRAALAGELERKNRELEAFSYSVSHDLRTPLRAISGFSSAAKEALPGDPDEAAGHLARVETAAARMAELIDDLLELSKVGRAALDCVRLDVAPLAEQVLLDLRRGDPTRSVEVRVEAPLWVHADPRLFLIVLENLLGNAFKFSGKQPQALIEVGAVVREGRRVLFVRDNGAGFDPAHAARLFAPFQRLHSQGEFPGTGIGLATVYRIVDRHRGRVWAESERGRGACFYIDLPATQPQEKGAN